MHRPMQAGRPASLDSFPFDPPKASAQGITMGDRLEALLNHVFSWEGLIALMTVAGILIDTLTQYGIPGTWAATLITVLSAVVYFGSKLAAAFGHGQLQTVLKVKGKLPA